MITVCDFGLTNTRIYILQEKYAYLTALCFKNQMWKKLFYFYLINIDFILSISGCIFFFFSICPCLDNFWVQIFYLCLGKKKNDPNPTLIPGVLSSARMCVSTVSRHGCGAKHRNALHGRGLREQVPSATGQTSKTTSVGGTENQGTIRDGMKIQR